VRYAGSRLCEICTEPIPLWRWDLGEFASRTCYSYHRDMLMDNEEKAWEVHDVPYWRPGADEDRRD